MFHYEPTDALIVQLCNVRKRGSGRSPKPYIMVDGMNGCHRLFLEGVPGSDSSRLFLRSRLILLRDLASGTIILAYSTLKKQGHSFDFLPKDFDCLLIEGAAGDFKRVSKDVHAF